VANGQRSRTAHGTIDAIAAPPGCGRATFLASVIGTFDAATSVVGAVAKHGRSCLAEGLLLPLLAALGGLQPLVGAVQPRRPGSLVSRAGGGSARGQSGEGARRESRDGGAPSGAPCDMNPAQCVLS